jgi:hypothetical protein
MATGTERSKKSKVLHKAGFGIFEARLPLNTPRELVKRQMLSIDQMEDTEALRGVLGQIITNSLSMDIPRELPLMRKVSGHD